MNNRSLVVCIQNTCTYVNVYISTRKGVHLTILIMYYSVKIKYTSLSRDIQRNFWLLFTIFKCKKQFYSYHHKYKCTYTWEILQTISISIWDIRCFARYLKKKCDLITVGWKITWTREFYFIFRLDILLSTRNR